MRSFLLGCLSHIAMPWHFLAFWAIGRGGAVKFVKPGGTKIFYHVPHGGRKKLPEYVVRSIQEIVRREHGHV